MRQSSDLIRCQESTVADIVAGHVSTIADEISRDVLSRFRDVIDNLLYDNAMLEKRISELEDEYNDLLIKHDELKHLKENRYVCKN